MATITTDVLNLVKKGVDMVIGTMPPQFEDQASMLFGKMSAGGQKSITVRTVTGFGAGEQKAEDSNITYDVRRQVYSQDIEPLKWVKAFKHSVETDFNDFYGENAKDAGFARDALLETRQIQAAAIFNDAFTGTSGPDGGDLCGTSVGAGSGNPTYSSRPTVDLALDPDNVAQMLSEMRAIADPRNFARRFRGNVKLIVPNELEFDARVIAESTLKSGTAENDANVVSKRINPHVMDYLTDATAWFLLAEDPSMHGLRVVEGMPMQSWVEKDIDVLGVKTAIWEQYKHFWVHSYGIRGTNP